MPSYAFLYLLGGAGSLGPERLMREDLVLVTVEYRVGPLGKFKATCALTVDIGSAFLVRSKIRYEYMWNSRVAQVDP
jgi:hypothetical protein